MQLPVPTEEEKVVIESYLAPMRNPDATIANKLRWAKFTIRKMVDEGASPALKSGFINSTEFIELMNNPEVTDLLCNPKRRAEAMEILGEHVEVTKV